jgi:hypothetical protein
MAPKTASLILPFPPARRLGLVRKLAAQMLARAPNAAEAHLRQQLQYQYRVLRRKGIADDVARRELRALESAVRAELWRLVMMPPRPRPSTG